MFKNKVFFGPSSTVFFPNPLSLLLVNNESGLGKFFFRELVLKGIGFKFARLNGLLFLKVGFSHYVSFRIDNTINVKLRKDRLVIFGSNLEQVTSFASTIRDFRPPDCYKFKGISFHGEVISLKAGKQR